MIPNPDMNLAALSGLASRLTGAPQLPSMAPNVQMAPPDIPRDLLGPTQSIFYGPGGRPSTHLNIVTEHPLLPGRQTMLPMLVPGQVEVGRLLSGQPATQAQYQRAQEWGRQQALQNQLLPTFDTIPEALQYEQQWRGEVIPQLEQRMPGLERLLGITPGG